MGLEDKNRNLQMGSSIIGTDRSWSAISGQYATAPPDDGALPQITFDDSDSDLSVEMEVAVNQQDSSSKDPLVEKSLNLKPQESEASEVKVKDGAKDELIMPVIGAPVFKDSIINIDQGFTKKRAQLQDDIVISSDYVADEKEASEEIDLTRPTILIVDDSKEVLNKHAQIFLAADYNVITAHDGLEGLDKATKIKPDLIFSGIIMPRMDGFAMIEGMRKNAEIMHTPVVITSHLGRAQDKTRASELEVRDFIVIDSVSPENLVKLAHNILTVREYSVPIDLSLPEYAGLVKDLGGKDSISCPDGKSHVLRIVVDSASDMRISGRVECA